MTEYPIIAISRESGTGGHDIAVLVAKKLGIPMYDNELLRAAAKDTGLDAELFDKLDEQHTSPIGLALLSNPLDDQLYEAQAQTIRDIAAKESAVIVGRCGDQTLKGVAPVLSVFIEGSQEKRIARVMERDGIDEAEALKQILRIDKARATYFNYYTDSHWGDRASYDLVLTSDYGLEAAADTIVAFAKGVFQK